MRLFSCLLIVGGLLAACSDGTQTVSSAASSGETSSGAGKTPKGTGSSPGQGDSEGNDGLSSTSSSSGTITNGLGDLDAIQSIKASKSTCGAAQGQCYDAQSFEVTFAPKTMKNVRCVELANDGGTSDAETTISLSADDWTKIRNAVSGIRTSNVEVSGFDGPQWILEVRTMSGTKLYAQTSGCGPQEQMTQISSGWNDLWALLSGIAK